jgi:hypothetical protein
VLLVGRALVGVARRDGDALDPQVGDEVEERRGARGLGVVEQGAGHVDPEAGRFDRSDRLDRALEHALLVDRPVVLLFQPVEMDRKGQVGVGFEEMQLLFEQQRVGAEVDEALARDQRGDDLADLFVQQGLAARDRDHRRAALLDRVDAVRDREPLVQDLVRIVDLAAAGAGEVAAEQGLEHEHQRIARAPPEALLEDISADADLLSQGNRQVSYSPILFGVNRGGSHGHA